MQDQLRGTERGNDPGDSQPNAVIHARASKVAPQRLQAMYPGGTGRNIVEAPGEGDEGALIGVAECVIRMGRLLRSLTETSTMSFLPRGTAGLRVVKAGNMLLS
jgi:hypothetical protein